MDSTFPPATVEQTTLHLASGQTIYIIVDGHNSGWPPDNEGPFTLTLTPR